MGGLRETSGSRWIVRLAAPAPGGPQGAPGWLDPMLLFPETTPPPPSFCSTSLPLCFVHILAALCSVFLFPAGLRSARGRRKLCLVGCVSPGSGTGTWVFLNPHPQPSRQRG